MGLLVACREEGACGIAHRRARRLGAVGPVLLLLVVGLQPIALGAQHLDELLELVGPLLSQSQATIEHLGARVRDGVLALELLDPDPLLARDACVVLADMGLPLHLGGQPRVRRPQPVELCEDIPVGFIPLERRGAVLQLNPSVRLQQEQSS